MSEKRINIERLADAFWELSKDPELREDMLKSEGYDPAKLEKAGISKIKKLLFQQEVALKKARTANLYAIALEKFQAAASDTKENLLNLLRHRAPSLQFRNFENLDEEMIRQVLDETELLDFMNQIEKGKL